MQFAFLSERDFNHVLTWDKKENGVVTMRTPIATVLSLNGLGHPILDKFRNTEKPKRRHGWAKLVKIKMDCIWINLKNIGPTQFFKFNLYKSNVRKHAVILPKKSAQPIQRLEFIQLTKINRITHNSHNTMTQMCFIAFCCLCGKKDNERPIPNKHSLLELPLSFPEPPARRLSYQN